MKIKLLLGALWVLAFGWWWYDAVFNDTSPEGCARCQKDTISVRHRTPYNNPRLIVTTADDFIVVSNGSKYAIAPRLQPQAVITYPLFDTFWSASEYRHEWASIVTHRDVDTLIRRERNLETWNKAFK